MHTTASQHNTAETGRGWPRLPTLIWLFLGFRLPILLLERPGGYLRAYPAIGTLGGVELGWQNWLTLGPMPLQPVVLEYLNTWPTTDLSRQLLVAGTSLVFEMATLIFLYLLTRRYGSELRARRVALFWALLWFPIWSWLTGIEGSGVALTLGVLWLLQRRRYHLAVVAAIATLLWMPAAVLVLLPAAAALRWQGRNGRRLDLRAGLRVGGILLLVLVVLQPRVVDPLLLLLPIVALLLPTVRGGTLAVLLSLLVVLHEPFAPQLLDVQSPVIDLLYAAVAVAAVGLTVELARPLVRPRTTIVRALRHAWTAAVGIVGLLILVSVPVALDEFHSIALAESPFRPLLDEFTAVRSDGYVLVGSHDLYERLYPLAWRQHTVRTVTERNRDELLAAIRAQPGPVWIVAHPAHAETNEVKDELLNAGYPADGDWFGDLRVERILVPAGPPLQPAEVDATFADAVTLVRAERRPSAVPGAWLPVELSWDVPPGGVVPSAIFVQLQDAEGERLAQHDSRPAWRDGQLTTRHALRLPTDLPPGTYTLVAGRYLPDTGQRVLLVSGEDGIILGDVRIQAGN